MQYYSYILILSDKHFIISMCLSIYIYIYGIVVFYVRILQINGK